MGEGGTRGEREEPLVRQTRTVRQVQVGEGGGEGGEGEGEGGVGEEGGGEGEVGNVLEACGTDKGEVGGDGGGVEGGGGQGEVDAGLGLDEGPPGRADGEEVGELVREGEVGEEDVVEELGVA